MPSDDVAIIPSSTEYGWTQAEYNADGSLKVQDFEDVSAILKQTEEERNSRKYVEFGEKGTQTSMRKLGTISPIQAQMLVEQGIFWDDKKLRAWFKDLDNYLWSSARGMK
jgi:hypothetical protein